MRELRGIMSNLAMLKKEKIRRSALDSFFYFLRNILGYPDVEVKPHLAVTKFLTDEPDLRQWTNLTPTERANNYMYIKKLLMLPRGHLKSSIVTVGLPIWLLCHDPTLRILIDNEVAKNSRLFLANIKQHIENERVKQLMTLANGEYPLKPQYDIAGGWTDSTIRLESNKTKEPSIMTAGIDTAVTGMHFDVIIMDDLVSPENTTTPDQMQKTLDHFRMAYSLLEPGGLLVVVGTRYKLDDLYSHLLKDDTFDKLIKPAISPDGDILFPKKFSKGRLEALKKAQGNAFYSQYMLTPIGGDNVIFKREDIKEFDDINEIPSNVNTFITIDLAISQKETADYTVLLVSQIDENGHIWLPEMVRGRFKPNDTLDHLFRLVDKYHPMKVGIESVAFQKSMIYFAKDEMQRRGKFFHIEELKPDRDKIRRAYALQPYVENGAVHIHSSLQTLIDELVTFPHAKHDDTVDAATYIPRLMVKPAPQRRSNRRYTYTPTNSVTGY